MGERWKELLAELVASADSETLVSFGLMVMATAMLRKKSQEPAGASGTDRGPQWVTPDEAVAEFGLDSRRLHRRWRRLDYCAPKVEGGRGFRVDRWAIQAKLAKKPLTPGRLPE